MISAGHTSSRQTAYYDRLRRNVERSAGVLLAVGLGITMEDS